MIAISPQYLEADVINAVVLNEVDKSWNLINLNRGIMSVTL